MSEWDKKTAAEIKDDIARLCGGIFEAAETGDAYIDAVNLGTEQLQSLIMGPLASNVLKRMNRKEWRRLKRERTLLLRRDRRAARRMRQRFKAKGWRGSCYLEVAM